MYRSGKTMEPIEFLQLSLLLNLILPLVLIRAEFTKVILMWMVKLTLCYTMVLVPHHH